jgi:hypothetical protein
MMGMIYLRNEYILTRFYYNTVCPHGNKGRRNETAVATHT